MATRIKLQRLGKKRQPQYRIVVADARTKREGRAIELIGNYHPKEDPSFIEVKSERVQYWLGVGAQPTESVQAILKVTGDWQKFKGLPAPEPMKVRAPKPPRPEIGSVFAQSDKAADATGGATTPKKKAPKKTDASAEAKSDAPAEAKADAKADAGA